MSNYAEIWQKLSAVDVSSMTETKQAGSVKLTYLSWAHAWAVMMEHYPDMYVTFTSYERSTETATTHNDVQYYRDGSAAVKCNVTIGGCIRSFTLPVMDHKNKAIQNPDAWAINTAKQRCMVKVFALFGLGHYIYAGEDLPVEPKSESATTGVQSDAPFDKAREIYKAIQTASSVKAITTVLDNNAEDLDLLEVNDSEKHKAIVDLVKRKTDALTEKEAA